MEQTSRFPFEAGANSEPDFKNPRRKRRSNAQAQVARVATGAHPEEVLADRSAPSSADASRAGELLAVLSGNKPTAPEQIDPRPKREASQEKPGQVYSRSPDTLPQPLHPELVSPDNAGQAGHFDLPRQPGVYAADQVDPRFALPQAPAPAERSSFTPVRPNETRKPNEEFVLHLNDEEAADQSGAAERVIPLHEGTVYGSPQFVGSRQPRAEQFTSVPAGPAETIPDSISTAELPDPYNLDMQRAVQETEQRQWVSQLPPEMVQAQAAYETPVSNAYYEATQPGVTTGGRFAGDYSEQVPSRREIKRALRDAEQRGASRGVITGVLAGGLYEHFKHRRREKVQQKLQKQEQKKQELRTKKLEQARTEIQLTSAQLARRQERTERELQTTQAQLAEARTAATQPVSAHGRAPAAPNGTERLQTPVKSQERPRFTMPATLEQVPVQRSAGERMLDPNKEPVQATDGRLEVPAGHRLNTEGWLVTELDKDGKVVEKPSFAYGQEYYRERAQEAGPQAQRAMATGEVALVAAALSQSGKQSKDKGRFDEPKVAAKTDTLGTGNRNKGMVSGTAAIPNATTQGVPSAARKATHPDGSPKAGSASKAAPDQADQPLWPWLVALAAVVIVLIFLI